MKSKSICRKCLVAGFSRFLHGGGAAHEANLTMSNQAVNGDRWSPECGLYDPHGGRYGDCLPMCKKCEFETEHAAAFALRQRSASKEQNGE
jgi:hypothetical protein